MTLCCTPNSTSSAASMTNAATVAAPSPPPRSMLFPTSVTPPTLMSALADETDQVQEYEQEDAVGDEAVDRDDNTPRGTAGGSR